MCSFKEIRLFMTKQGFCITDVQKYYQRLVQECRVTYSLSKDDMVYIIINVTKDFDIAGKHLLGLLQALESFGQPYDCDYGASQRDFGSYSRLYRPDQDFGKFAFQENRHVIVRYNEVNANSVYQDFRKAINLLKQGESGKAREFLASCVPPEAKDLEDYLVEKGVI